MACWMKNNAVDEERRADEKNKTNVPLQVRSPFYERNRFSAQEQKKAPSGSRAFPFISFPGHWCRKRHGKHRGKAGVSKLLRASLTLEAALVLPLVIFASVCLMLPAKLMITERKLQAGLEAAGGELSQYDYLVVRGRPRRPSAKTRKPLPRRFMPEAGRWLTVIPQTYPMSVCLVPR